MSAVAAEAGVAADLWRLLSEGEQAVAALIIREGLGNRALATRLVMSEAGVRSRIRSLCRKLGVRTRVRVAARLGAVPATVVTTPRPRPAAPTWTSIAPTSVGRGRPNGPVGNASPGARISHALAGESPCVRPSPRARVPAGLSGLSAHEVRVARLITEGLSNQVIADRLELPIETLKSQVRKIFLGLRVYSRVELAALVAAGGERAALAARDERVAVLLAKLGETPLDGEQRALVDELHQLVGGAGEPR